MLKKRILTRYYRNFATYNTSIIAHIREAKIIEMNVKQQYKRFKAWQLNAFDWSYDENEHHYCVNCENDFVGNHCPHCSQKAGAGKISWKSVLQSTAEVWGMHNRSLLYTLWQLIWRPGYFISDYINGKRQVSFPPVKTLVIMGVIGAIVDYLYKAPAITRNVITKDSSLSDRIFNWIEANPGWGSLCVVCFFLIPTWCIFRYAPRNARHSLPQGFFIQVFMGIQFLIIDNLSDFFGEFFYIMVPMCYFYAYRQLFGYNFLGNMWRVLLMFISGASIFIFVLSITEFLTTRSISDVWIFLFICSSTLATISLLLGLLISKSLVKRKEKKRKEQEVNTACVDDQIHINLEETSFKPTAD